MFSHFHGGTLGTPSTNTEKELFHGVLEASHAIFPDVLCVN
jgi:hypothetical protein